LGRVQFAGFLLMSRKSVSVQLDTLRISSRCVTICPHCMIDFNSYSVRYLLLKGCSRITTRMSYAFFSFDLLSGMPLPSYVSIPMNPLIILTGLPDFLVGNYGGFGTSLAHLSTLWNYPLKLQHAGGGRKANLAHLALLRVPALLLMQSYSTSLRISCTL